MRNWLDHFSPNALRHILNWWPPFKFSGIKTTVIAADFRYIQVILKQRWYNRNYVGTHFGGSMFAMTDPFYMLMLLKNLGKNYIVWDKASAIEFIKPGKGTLTANFTFTEAELQEIRDTANSQDKLIFNKKVEIFNESNEITAAVVKTLYIKRK